jgi:hypothetical protein
MSQTHEAAIEAAVKQLCYSYGDEWGELLPGIQGLLLRDTGRIVTAYQTAMAADVRAAIVTYRKAVRAVDDRARFASYGDPDLDALLDQAGKAEAALLDLLGATEPTITEGKTA